MSIEMIMQDGGIATIRLNRPEKKNAMLLSMRDELATLCERVNDDPLIRVAILTGSGSDFCAGADVTEMGLAGINGSLLRARHMHKAISAIHGVRKPLIGVIRGAALGMGLSMALACDYVLASRSLKMGCVQRKLGLSPDGGNVWFLARQVGAAKAKELVFSARMFGAEEAVALGIVSELVDENSLDQRALEVARSFSEGPTLALGVAKQMFDRARSMTLEQFMDYEESVVPLIAQSSDFKEGTTAFMEKRQPRFTGN